MPARELSNRLKSRLNPQAETGQTMSEYAFILALLVPGALLLFTGLGDAVVSGITNVARLLP